MKDHKAAKMKNKHKKIKRQNPGVAEDFPQRTEEDLEVGRKWYEELPVDPKDFKPVTDQVLIELRDEAKKLLESSTNDFNSKNAKDSNFQWMKTVMSKGTLQDQLAARTVSIQDHPLYNLSSLRNLVNMVQVSKKNECAGAMDAVAELFLTDLLRPDMKLRAFSQQPISALDQMTGGDKAIRKKILNLWYFEAELKEIYISFVDALNKVGRDTIDANKEKAIGAMYKLLAGNPEQEQRLLGCIVNKLGDPSPKVASKAIYGLNQLLFKHPNMQGVVLKEIEKLIFRSNVSQKAQYYGLCFLSQFSLDHESSDVAKKLIEVYFAFFTSCIKKGEVDSRMMSALLEGVNRAYPFAKPELEKNPVRIEELYRIVKNANNFKISLHALALLQQVFDQGNETSSKYYGVLYNKLLDSKLFATTYQAMLLSLVYKSMLRDGEVSRVKAFVKRLLQLALFMQPSFGCGILYLVSQLMGKKENIQSLILKQTAIEGVIDVDEEDEKYYDVKDEVEENANQSVQEEDEKEEKPDVEKLNDTMAGPSWHHRNVVVKKESKVQFQYDPRAWNPLAAGAEHSAYSELVNLTNHFHPTVALYAKNILEGKIIKYNGDPLKDYTLIRFLDRFVFKNPKKIDEIKGAHPIFGRRKLYKPKGIRSFRVTSESYLNENEKNIPEDERFMYTYLQKKYKENRVKKEDDDDLDSVQSEEFEDYLENLKGADDMLGDMEDDDLDFMNDIGETLKATKKTKAKKDGEEDDDIEMSEDDDDDGEDLDDDSDEDVDLEMNEDDKDLLGDLEDDDEDEDIVFDDDDDEDDVFVKKGKKNKKTNKLDGGSVFASAEKFASLLQDEGSSRVAPGGSSAVSNKDNASVKQIAWEEKNRWLSGYNKALGKKGKKDNKGKQFGKRKSHQNQSGNKRKKMKK